MLYKLYKRWLSDQTRGKLRGYLFYLFRFLKIGNFLSHIDLIICKDYLLVNHKNLESLTEGKNISFSTETHVAYLRKSKTLPGSKLNDMELDKFTSEVVVLDIREKKFSFRNNHILDNEIRVVGGFNIPFRKLSIHNQFLPDPCVYEGVIAYLSDPAYWNYYHWMCCTLPMLATYDKHRGLDDIDYFYIGDKGINKFHLESLERAGISPNRIIQNSCTSNRLLASIYNRFIGFNDPISHNSFIYSRSLFSDLIQQNSSKPKKRIYVQRGSVSRRRVLNEEDLLDFLKVYGFESVQMDGKSIEEQASIFSSAEAIVAPHGAALTNLLFTSPKTTVIELLPYGYSNNCFTVLSSYAGIDHFYLVGKKTKTSNYDSHSLDIDIDIARLSQLCFKAGF